MFVSRRKLFYDTAHTYIPIYVMWMHAFSALFGCRWWIISQSAISDFRLDFYWPREALLLLFICFTLMAIIQNAFRGIVVAFHCFGNLCTRERVNVKVTVVFLIFGIFICSFAPSGFTIIVYDLSNMCDRINIVYSISEYPPFALNC